MSKNLKQLKQNLQNATTLNFNHIDTYEKACSAAVKSILAMVDAGHQLTTLDLTETFMETFEEYATCQDTLIAELNNTITAERINLTAVVDELEKEMTCRICGKFGYHSANCCIEKIKIAVKHLELLGVE